MTRNEITTVTQDGMTDVVRFHGQPTTEDIASITSPSERWVIQRVGPVYEVYDRRTLTNKFGTWVIGVPVFTHEDEDAAVMWAMMRGAG